LPESGLASSSELASRNRQKTKREATEDTASDVFRSPRTGDNLERGD